VVCVVFQWRIRFTIGKLHHKKYGTEYNSFDALRAAFADSADSDEAFCDDNSFEERAIGSFEEEEHHQNCSFGFFFF